MDRDADPRSAEQLVAGAQTPALATAVASLTDQVRRFGHS
jgi:hypothetical protein